MYILTKRPDDISRSNSIAGILQLHPFFFVIHYCPLCTSKLHNTPHEHLVMATKNETPLKVDVCCDLTSYETSRWVELKPDVYHYGRCAILFNKNTVYTNIDVKSIFLPDTKRDLPARILPSLVHTISTATVTTPVLGVLVNTLQYHDTVDFVQDTETENPQLVAELWRVGRNHRKTMGKN